MLQNFKSHLFCPHITVYFKNANAKNPSEKFDV